MEAVALFPQPPTANISMGPIGQGGNLNDNAPPTSMMQSQMTNGELVTQTSSTATDPDVALDVHLDIPMLPSRSPACSRCPCVSVPLGHWSHYGESSVMTEP